jgi:anti-anti-sigma factor
MKPSGLVAVSGVSPAQEFSVNETSGCTVVTVYADLDIGTADAFKGLVDSAVVVGRPVVVDLSACSYADSTGLRFIAVASTTFPAGSGIVVAPKGTVRRLFAITGFDFALSPVATLAEALRNAEVPTRSDA